MENEQEVKQGTELSNGKDEGKTKTETKKRNFKPRFCGKRGGKNDVRWYSKYPQLIKDAANLPFSDILGLPFTKFEGLPTVRCVIPGIMKVGIVPTLGFSDNANSNVNIAARKLYTYVRHANSGSANYEASDMMMYLLNLSNIYSFIGALARIYGICRTYNARNRYWAKGVLQAMGLDVPDLMQHINDIRGLHNYLVAQVNSFGAPKNLSLFEKMYWAQSGIYKDSESDKAQIYFMEFDYYLRWTGTLLNTGTALKPVRIPTTGTGLTISFKDLQTFGKWLIEDMYGDEDFGIISGDIMKAFRDNLWIMGFINEEFYTEAKFEESFLWQIQNLHCYGFVDSSDLPASPELQDYLDRGYVVQFNNVISCDPRCKLELGVDYSKDMIPVFQTEKVLINSRKDENTPEDVMEATRLTAYATKFSEIPNDNVCLFASGIYSDVLLPTQIHIFRFVVTGSNGNGFDTISEFHSASYMPVVRSGYSVTTEGQSLSVAIDSSQFDWHPIMLNLNFSTMDRLTGAFLIGDLDNYTMFDKHTLSNLHNIALFSEFTSLI